MKSKPLLLCLVVLFVASGLWVGWTTWHPNHPPVTPENESAVGAGNKTPSNGTRSGHTLQPPDPNRRFRDLSPEQRVQLARRGPVGG